ncbi:hypothetical protein [Streptomyces sp. NBC_01268]|uniref:hypothetical protein n=1 Tax=Streptomyces sp. NBC_01268 TaxID=2903806 RepID=UPI002E2EF913|nr:hypothetical protein [Streptomyces sp. NBC_01268]
MATSRRIKAFVACAAALLGVTATTASTTAATAATRAQDPPARFHHQRLTWHTCTLDVADELGRALDAAGADCADIIVPLDYTDLDGRTITVALSRMKATDTAHRVGVPLLNDGGPAGPGLHMPLTKSRVMGDVAARYDLFGMDPRFVGRSTPLDCGWDVGSAFARSAGSGVAAYREEAAVARELAARCKRAEAPGCSRSRAPASTACTGSTETPASTTASPPTSAPDASPCRTRRARCSGSPPDRRARGARTSPWTAAGS